jgi:hypothetical protein
MSSAPLYFIVSPEIEKLFMGNLEMILIVMGPKSLLTLIFVTLASQKSSYCTHPSIYVTHQASRVLNKIVRSA